MNRRSFLKGVAATVTAGSAMAYPSLANAAPPDEREKDINELYPSFTFNKDGKFKVLQFTDTHYISGDPRSERALNNVKEMLDTEKPDLVIHTGDIFFAKGAKKCAEEILSPIAERKIPFAVALGNHDSDFDLTRREAFDVIRKIPYNINTPEKNITGASNDLIMLRSAKDKKVKWAFYLFDTNNRYKENGMDTWGYVHFDQIDWYRKLSTQLTKQNNGQAIPAIAFMHIPVKEYNDAFRDTHRIMRGSFGEEPCACTINNGLFLSMQEMKDVKAIVTGHDHDNDYAMKWNNMYFIYGRFSGCDTVYNHLKPNGARIFEFTEGQTGWTSWIRLSTGAGIIQKLRFPEDFNT